MREAGCIVSGMQQPCKRKEMNHVLDVLLYFVPDEIKKIKKKGRKPNEGRILHHNARMLCTVHGPNLGPDVDVGRDKRLRGEFFLAEWHPYDDDGY